MRCHLCSGWIEIHTDPQNAEYKVVEGGRRKVETYDTTGQVQISGDDEEEAKRRLDPIYRLERSAMDREEAATSQPRLVDMMRLNERQWSDPYAASQKLRRQFREEKRERVAKERATNAIRDRLSLALPLLDESVDDQIASKLIDFHASSPNVNITAARVGMSRSTRSNQRSSTNTTTTLARNLQIHTRAKVDPFLKPPKRSSKSKVKVQPKHTRASSLSRSTGLVEYGSE